MKHTIDNPKLVKNYYNFEGAEDFTGIVKDEKNTIAYYLNGNFHREDGPAVEWTDGYQQWLLNGEWYGDNDNYTNESWIRFVKLELLK